MITSLLVPLQVVMLAASSATPAITSGVTPITATRYEYSTQSQSGGGAPKTVSRMVNTIAGEKFFRTEVVESEVPPGFGMYEAGSYMVSEDGGRHMYSVNTAKNEFFEVDTKQLLKSSTGMLDALNNGGLGAKMSMSGFKIDVTDLGPGEVILGRPTQHWHTRQTMNMTMVMGKDSIVISTETTTDAFYGKDTPHFSTVPQAAKDTAPVDPYGMFGTPEEVAKARAAMKRLPSGMPLRSVAVTIGGFGAMQMKSTNTTEITKIETVQVEPDFFQVPRGFAKVDMPVMELPGVMLRPPAEIPNKK